MGIFISIIIPAIIFLAGCTHQQDTQNQNTSTPAESTKAICTPVKVAVIQDNSGSINWTGTPILQTDDLSSLIQVLHRCGGEIGFGLISENSNKGLIRLFIDMPPVEPIEPSRRGNPQKVAKRFDIYRHEVDKFKSDFALWQDNIEQNISRFIADVDLALKKNNEAKKSDVWQAIRRADLFLSEESNAWDRKPRNYALIITDGQDNVRKEKVVSMNSEASLLTVNASGIIGSLAGLQPSMFESIASAVRYICDDVEGNE